MDNRTTENKLPPIVQKVTLNAPIERVWSVVATSEGIASWFMPNDFQPELGYEFHLNAGPFGMSPCKVTELDPPNRLAFSWDEDWSVTFALEEKDGVTEFTLIHDGWPADGSTRFGQPYAVVRETMSGGWVGIVAKLARLFEG
ncbi:SRPBCC family protein [Paenibacillus koleovorans]|uniref:SRPBCC family protein n=1 Tax=Paenibacillus koleovorans TaxID=121608 RepID=UPI000FD71DC0|nr:SRPBCC domain-containing protein [Paenibacillus koleovorans]